MIIVIETRSTSMAEQVTNPVVENNENVSKINEDELKKANQLVKEMEALSMKYNLLQKKQDLSANKEYKFWKTQPVPKLDENPVSCEPIEADKKPDEIRQDSLNLPSGYKWDTLDIEDPEILKELYTLLSNNYVEDDDNMFRFNYSPEFLQWALKPPNWKKDWHCGLRVEKTDKLVGFISGVPASVRVKDKVVRMVEINFLCVVKVLRSKRMAPVLIKEITRRVHLHGIFQAVYTAGVYLPKPVGTSSYWHRSLNPKKLIDIKFSQLGRNMTMARTIKFYKLPAEPKQVGFRSLEPKDVEIVCPMLNEYLNKFDLVPIYGADEFAHWFLPREDVVDSYVVEQDNKIVGFTSFFTLPSSVMFNQNHKSIKAAYSFFNVPSEQVGLKALMTDALIMAKKKNYDVFNALDLMDNKEFLQDLKFGVGDGNLHYYLYNYKCPTIQSDKIGLILQ